MSKNKNDMIYTFRVPAGKAAKLHNALTALRIFGPFTVQFVKPERKAKKKS